ncbi:hypothetical protein G2W53_033128 [Senna tora]|uniref:Uncharacterized protein n=1 Tax=Senna tora TaxID=362788 RepID=A0A834W7N4_9FABA|nr:hypothetical protein G2W53_033128 [Senna tora]
MSSLRYAHSKPLYTSSFASSCSLVTDFRGATERIPSLVAIAFAGAKELVEVGISMELQVSQLYSLGRVSDSLPLPVTSIIIIVIIYLSLMVLDPVIELPDCHAGLDDGDVVLDIDGDAPEVEEVEDDEWLVRDVGDALEVVAAASDFDLDWDGFGADDGGLDVGFVKRGYDE